MNSHERVMAALRLQEPDQVPVLEWAISPTVIRAICPGAKDQTDIEDMLGLDGVSTVGEFGEVRVGPDSTYMDEWGVWFKPTPEELDHPIKSPIRTMEDLKSYVPPDPNAPQRLGKLPELVARYKGKKAIFFRHRAAFMWSVFLNGFENLLENFLLDPELAHAVMDTVMQVSIPMARNAIRAGADAIVIADDYAGNDTPFFSVKVFKEFVLPRLQRMVDAIHEEGGIAVKHSDGNLWPLLDLIVDTGVDAINPLEPVAGMNIGEVKRRYGKRVCLIGNIDCGRLLPYGTREDVQAAVHECIRQASPGGGYILASSNCIHSSVKPENYVAMVNAARKYGTYPISQDA